MVYRFIEDQNNSRFWSFIKKARFRQLMYKKTKFLEYRGENINQIQQDTEIKKFGTLIEIHTVSSYVLLVIFFFELNSTSIFRNTEEY